LLLSEDDSGVWLPGLPKPAFCLVQPVLKTQMAGSSLPRHWAKTQVAPWLAQTVRWIAEQQFQRQVWFVPEQSLRE
jgi:hypothetical protein